MKWTFEELVKFSTPNCAEIMVHDIPDDEKGMDLLISALIKLKNDGFKYSYTDYSSGYYGAAEDITLNFIKKK